MATKEETVKSDGPKKIVAYSSTSIVYNHNLIEYCRTSMAALAGSTAGIIGLTALHGFAFFMVMMLVLWVMIMMMAGANWDRYFLSRASILTTGFFGALTTYVLFWTFLYGMVHVY